MGNLATGVTGLLAIAFPVLSLSATGGSLQRNNNYNLLAILLCNIELNISSYYYMDRQQDLGLSFIKKKITSIVGR